MKQAFTLTFLLALLLAAGPSAAQPPTFAWAHNLCGAEDPANRGRHIATDATGAAYTAGTFNGTADFDPGPGTAMLASSGRGDLFLTKHNASGALVWVRQLVPGPGGNVGLAVDAAGAFDWVVPFGGTTGFGSGNEAGTALTVDAAGRIYATGVFHGPSDFDPGPGVATVSGCGAFVVKLLPAGLSVGEMAGAALSLNPNPVVDWSVIKFSSPLRDGTLRMISATGAVVCEWRGVRGASFRMDVSALPLGVYVVEVSTQEGRVQRARLVKQ